jgi:hypothetical protein
MLSDLSPNIEMAGRLLIEEKTTKDRFNQAMVYALHRNRNDSESGNSAEGYSRGAAGSRKREGHE